jgi:hypothetical protein
LVSVACRQRLLCFAPWIVAGRLRPIERPLPFQLFKRSIVNIDIHVVLSSGNCVETSSAIRGTAILFAGKLPERVARPGALRKVSHVSFEARVPEVRFRKHVRIAKLISDRLRHQAASAKWHGRPARGCDVTHAQDARATHGVPPVAVTYLTRRMRVPLTASRPWL